MELVQNDNFKEELRRLEEDQFERNTNRKGLALSIDRHLEGRITESELRIRSNLKSEIDEDASFKKTDHTMNFSNQSPIRMGSQ